jgi:hypothetical protein
LTAIFALSGIVLYFYSNSPNNVVVLSKPVNINDLSDDLNFPLGEIPNFIKQVNENNIIYQATVNYNDFVRECRYVLLIRPDKGSVNLKNKLPVVSKDYEQINKLLHFNELQNPFIPSIVLPDNMKSESGIRIKIYNPKVKEVLNLNSGSYQYFISESIDKEGYYTEVIFFDEVSNFLYYERMRFHAFQ